MKVFSIIIIVSLAIILTGCFKELPLEQVKKCEFGSDCIMTYSPGCCKCPAAINKDYSDYWDQLNKKQSRNCEGAVCDQCGPIAISADCLNQTCTLLYSPVGVDVNLQ
jgi:hypothetical protein